MKVLKRKIIQAVAGIALVGTMTACQTIDPEVVSKNITVYLPEYDAWTPQFGDEKKKDVAPVPVVYFLQGSDGGNSRATEWSDWFNQYGIGSVIISSAQMRNTKRLFGVSSYAYAADVKSAMALANQHPGVDPSHYAIMGFSKGGTAALEASGHLEDGMQRPDFVFSLYPGNASKCPNYAEETTDVRVFYGDLDDWGTYQGNRSACESMADRRNGTTFHLLKGAHHGYDGSWSGKWSCCGGRTFTSAPNQDAKNKTKEIILEAMKKRWNIEG